MYAVTREFHFSAAHRIEGHPRCSRLHGHNYKVTVCLYYRSLDSSGMTIDFGAVDAIVKPLVDQMDHRYLVSRTNFMAEDPYAKTARELGHEYILDADHSTAECLARLLGNWIYAEVSRVREPQRVRIEVQETPKNVGFWER